MAGRVSRLLLALFAVISLGRGAFHLRLSRPLPVVVPGAGFDHALLGLLAIGLGLILTRKGQNP